MPQPALLVRHQTLPGQRDEVRRMWERHMQPAIAAYPGFIAYFYCFADDDPDAICAFQQYESAEAAQNYTRSDAFQRYSREVEPLLARPPQITMLTPQWSTMRGPA